MESLQGKKERLKKARLKEKARIDKLRELNLKKYGQSDTQSITKTPSMVSQANGSLNNSVKPRVSTNSFKRPSTFNQVEQNFNVNGTSNQPGQVTVDKAKPLKLVSSQICENPKESISRKNMLPMIPIGVSKNRDSLYHRLCKPNIVQNPDLSDTDRLRTDPIFLQKVLQRASFILKNTPDTAPTSAMLRKFKFASPLTRMKMLGIWNNFHTSSSGEKRNQIDVTNTNEDDKVKQDTVTSAIKSKQARFLVPIRKNRTVSKTIRKKSRGKAIDS